MKKFSFLYALPLLSLTFCMVMSAHAYAQSANYSHGSVSFKKTVLSVPPACTTGQVLTRDTSGYKCVGTMPDDLICTGSKALNVLNANGTHSCMDPYPPIAENCPTGQAVTDPLTNVCEKLPPINMPVCTSTAQALVIVDDGTGQLIYKCAESSKLYSVEAGPWLGDAGYNTKPASADNLNFWSAVVGRERIYRPSSPFFTPDVPFFGDGGRDPCSPYCTGRFTTSGSPTYATGFIVDYNVGTGQATCACVR
jgi:hypothetical protein